MTSSVTLLVAAVLTAGVVATVLVWLISRTATQAAKAAALEVRKENAELQIRRMERFLLAISGPEPVSADDIADRFRRLRSARGDSDDTPLPPSE